MALFRGVGGSGESAAKASADEVALLVVQAENVVAGINTVKTEVANLQTAAAASEANATGAADSAAASANVASQAADAAAASADSAAVSASDALDAAADAVATSAEASEKVDAFEITVDAALTQVADPNQGFNVTQRNNLGQIAEINFKYIEFSSDGLTLFCLNGDGANTLNSYSLPTPYDLSGVTATPDLSTPCINAAVTQFFFNADGTLYYESSTNNIIQYQLSTPYDITTASNGKEADLSFNIGGFSIQEGTNAIMVTERNNANIVRYITLTDPNEFNSTFDTIKTSVLPVPNITGLDTGYISRDGSRWTALDFTSDNLVFCSFTTPFDFDTAANFVENDNISSFNDGPNAATYTDQPMEIVICSAAFNDVITKLTIGSKTVKALKALDEQFAVIDDDTFDISASALSLRGKAISSNIVIADGGVFSNNAQTNFGTDAVGIGNNTLADGLRSVAIGRDADAGATDAIAIGFSSDARGAGAVVIGESGFANGSLSVAVGADSKGNATGAVSVGSNANCTAGNAITIGRDSQGIGTSGIAIGYLAEARSRDIMIGERAGANKNGGQNNVGIGGYNWSGHAGVSDHIILSDGNGDIKLTIDDSSNATFAGDVTANSDRRLKSNIEVIPDAMDKVKQLTGYTYDMAGRRRTGVIAQEVEEVMPELVSTSELGIKSVAYGNLTALLIEAVKELKEEVRDLKERLGE